MGFKEKLDLAKNILSDCPYETQKKIIELFILYLIRIFL